MENSAIRQGFEALKDGTQYENLYSAAQARERADWLTGMNLSRLFTLVYGGGKNNDWKSYDTDAGDDL